MFKVGDLVKVEESALEWLGIPKQEISGLLVVNDVISENDRMLGVPHYELRNGEGDYYGLFHNVLEAV